MARRSKIDIRVFRKQVAALKKAGIVTNVDVRKAIPSQIKSGSTLLELTKKYKKVIDGTQAAVKLSPDQTKAHKAVGDKVIKSTTGQKLVLIDKDITQKVTADRKGVVKIESPNGIEYVQVPVEYKDLPQYLRKIIRDTDEIDRMKKNDEWFAFRFYGHKSRTVFRNIDLLIKYLRKYEDVAQALRGKNAKAQREIYKNLEIVKVHRKRDWPLTEVTKSHGSSLNQYSKRKRRQSRLPEVAQRGLAEKHAAQEKARRAKVKAKGGLDYKKSLDASKQRAKKARGK